MEAKLDEIRADLARHVEIILHPEAKVSENSPSDMTTGQNIMTSLTTTIKSGKNPVIPGGDDIAQPGPSYSFASESHCS